MKRIAISAAVVLGLLVHACNGCEVNNVQNSPGTLKGTVCHQVTGRVLQGVAVLVKAKEAGNERQFEQVTDAQGRFELSSIPPGTADVALTGEGLGAAGLHFTQEITTAKVTEWMDPACIDPMNQLGKGCVVGQVCNRHTGTFVNDATVTVLLSNVNAGGDPSTLESTTNAQGIFQICNVPEGTQTVLVRAVGYQKAFTATVTAGQTTDVVQNPSCTHYDPQVYCIVRGRVCTAETPPGWLPDAKVTALLLDASGNPQAPPVREAEQEFTDNDGRYELYLQPEGRWRIQVQKGSFSSSKDVDCLVGESTVIQDGTQCVTAGQCKFLVATGVFDRVESVLGRVGVPTSRIDLVNGNPADLHEDWAFRTFGVLSSLDPYCAIFFNCGIDETAFVGPFQNPVVLRNLRTFVERGGTVYASDEAYDVIEQMYPGKLDYYRNDDLGSDAEFGLPQTVVANVIDDTLHSYLGQDTVSIKFNYQAWVPVVGTDMDVQVYLRGNATACADGEPCTSQIMLQNVPLTLRYMMGNNGGQVMFTSFHLETRNPGDGGVGEEVSTGDTDRVMRFLMTL